MKFGTKLNTTYVVCTSLSKHMQCLDQNTDKKTDICETAGPYGMINSICFAKNNEWEGQCKMSVLFCAEKWRCDISITKYVNFLWYGFQI